MFGWRVRQKREDRIDTALFCRDIWHNLFSFNPVPDSRDMWYPINISQR